MRFTHPVNTLKKLGCGLAFGATAIMAMPTSALACTQIYMGSKLTADGNTYYGRSEDFGPRYVKHFGIEPAHKDGNEYTSVESGFEYKSKGATYRYTFVRDNPSQWEDRYDAYSEAGINEKGVSIAVLTLDSEPTKQDTGKPVLATTMAIRLVLDRAATTAEAVELLQQYDMFATSGRDYHFYITDAAGDGRVIEYDCDDPARPMVVTPSQQVTNFFVKYKENVLPNQKNGIYGHGRERYDTVLKILAQQKDVLSPLTVWDALRAVAQEPDSKDITSNTQWSICFHNSTLSADVALRRHWDNIFRFRLTENTATALS